MMRSSAPSLQTGFATVFAVGLIALVAIALSAMAAVVGVEMRQSRAAAADVQIRLMLLAAAPSVQAALSNAQPAELIVSLPDALKQNDGSLVCSIDPKGDTATVTVRASYNRFVRSQVLIYTKNNGQWTLSKGILLPPERA